MYGPLTHGTINQRLFYGAAIIVLIMMLMPQTAHAAGSAMPWEGPLTSILQSIEVPVRRSLTEPILLGGVPRTAAILNGTLAAALGLGLQLWLLGIIYYVCAHTLCVFFASRDPQFMEVLVRHIKHKGYLA